MWPVGQSEVLIVVSSNRSSARSPSASRYGGTTRGAPGRRVSYSTVDPALVHRVVALVCDAGDAVTFGTTSEGGAYYVGVLSDGQLDKSYLDSLEALQERLTEISDIARALVQ